jgi:hypothetical protein
MPLGSSITDANSSVDAEDRVREANGRESGAFACHFQLSKAGSIGL